MIYTQQDILIDAMMGNSPPNPQTAVQLPNGDTGLVDIELKFEIINGELCVVYDKDYGIVFGKEQEVEL